MERYMIYGKRRAEWTLFWNNLHQIRSYSKDWKLKPTNCIVFGSQ